MEKRRDLVTIFYVESFVMLILINYLTVLLPVGGVNRPKCKTDDLIWLKMTDLAVEIWEDRITELPASY